MAGSKVYLTGESYAGQYIPYFASAMLDANDTEYFNVQGTLLIDPAISIDVNLVELPMLAFAEANQPILRFNESFRSLIRDLHAKHFNYTGFFETYFKFPMDGPMPTPPNADDDSSPFRRRLIHAATVINPCFNVYHILHTCPRPVDFLGVSKPLRGNGTLFFNLPEVQSAMHAPPNSEWRACAAKPVFASADGRDQSARPDRSVLPRVFDRVPINIVANGALDIVIPSLGTLFALQNITWRGITGFEKRPSRKFVVPRRPVLSMVQEGGSLGAAGEMGTWGWERGVLFVDVEGAGHMLPQDNPSAAFRLLEVLLGRVGVEEGMDGAPWSV